MQPTDRYSFFAERRVTAPLPPANRGELPISLPLRHGGMAETSIRYELVGQAGAPLFIVAGGISAGRHVLASDEFAEPGWWQSQALSFDPASCRLLAIDWLGADGSIDRPIDPADQAEALTVLLDHLGVRNVSAFIGASYGAMVGMHFAARNSDRLGGLLAISGSSASHPFASACRALQRQALAIGETHRDPESGVALARAMAILTYRTPQEFAERFNAAPALVDGRLRVAAQDYLDAQGTRHCSRMSSIAYRRLSESIDLHRIDAADIRVPTTLVAVDHDALVPREDIEDFAGAVPGAAFHLIRSRFGHDAFLKEDAQIGAIITSFLVSLEIPR